MCHMSSISSGTSVTEPDVSLDLSEISLCTSFILVAESNSPENEEVPEEVTSL